MTETLEEASPRRIAEMEAHRAVYYMREALENRVEPDVAARILQAAIDAGNSANIQYTPLMQAWERINKAGADRAEPEILKAEYRTALEQLKP